MPNTNLTEQQLKESASNGERQAAKALSLLAKQEVDVSTLDAQSVDSEKIQSVMSNIDEHSVVAFTQALTGVSGVSLLALNRKDALNLVDVFNNRPSGTTVVLQELDRSTIRETLNILANSYATELAKLLGDTILLSVPHMVTTSKLNEVSSLVKGKDGKTILFNTQLKVGSVDFEVNLYFFFLAGTLDTNSE